MAALTGRSGANSGIRPVVPVVRGIEEAAPFQDTLEAPVSAGEIALPGRPVSVATRRQLEAQMASARQHWELAATARHAAAQDMNDEWQMYCCTACSVA
jgi:hypothetical protein